MDDRGTTLQDNRFLEMKRIDDASREVTSTEEILQAESVEHRHSYASFYNNLALFSGGTLALSITYLGYLKTLAKPVAHTNLLIWSWTILFLCVVCSLFTNYFGAHYWYFARHSEHAGKMKKLREAEASGLPFQRFANITSPHELSKAVQELKQAATAYEGAEKWAGFREKRYFRMWKYLGRIARFGFLVGLGLLLLFAVLNI